MAEPLATRNGSVRRLGCSRCGTAFDCGSGGTSGGCWCVDEAYRLPMPKSAAQDCLCPNCLRAMASSVATGPVAA